MEGIPPARRSSDPAIDWHDQQAPMRESRPKRFARLLLQTFILIAAMGLSAVTAIRIAIQGREVEVPDLVKMSATDAQIILSRRELGMKVSDRVFSELPVDQVVRQSPQPGTIVKTGQRAHVVLSLGPQSVTIPELEGKSIRAARVELLRGGMQLGEITSTQVPGAEPEMVIRQNPPPRATNVGSPRVNLLVSAPPPEESYVMPDYIGMSLSEVPGKIAAARLRLAKVQFVPSGSAAHGTVVSQSPARGARIALGANVELQVVE